ncbi:lamin Dm0-like [Musca autumnalis]|uniref:lamin Dm0-like n=1 Tax=Musca autumnalis TaxID=221902 RepID=UPI003CF67F42
MAEYVKKEKANLRESEHSSGIEDLLATRTGIYGLNSYIRELESTNAALNGRNCDLEKLLANEHRRHASDIANVEAELQRCRDEMAQQLHEYQDLMEIKDSLDFEVAAYEKLLCGSVKDNIEISKSDPEVRVQKKGTKEVHIGGYRFKSNADDKENNVNFHRSEKMEGDVKKLMLSATHEPPTKISMKQKKWKSGGSKTTSLFNADEEEAKSSVKIFRWILKKCKEAMTVKSDKLHCTDFANRHRFVKWNK